MAENKTRQNDLSVSDYVDAITDPVRRQDCLTLIELMSVATGHQARMWGTSIVGFDTRHYRYESGREGDICLIGFASRKQDLALYLTLGAGGCDDLLADLGKHKLGKGCLYIKRLSEIDLSSLTSIIEQTVIRIRQSA
ncbi:DUF1801 domain-containing protein [Undibacterium sp. RuTC16W]|uniref:DUF1801 domain-containing protein n=1 Tax=Undibacterium sp. RuTC16W TaxID=3413048 RepID=UPI003BF05573